MIPWIAGDDFVLCAFEERRGNDGFGDSGDELGDGSVMDVPAVEIVVVGDDSTDSKVDAESRRKDDGQVCCVLLGRLLKPADLFGTCVAAVPTSLHV